MNQWIEREIYWIAHHKAQGDDLTNSTDGGENPPSSKGRTLSSSHRAALLRANTGKKRSLETRVKLSKAITQHDAEGHLIRCWSSAREAAVALDIHYCSICQCLRGRSNQSGGYIWRYVDKTNEIAPFKKKKSRYKNVSQMSSGKWRASLNVRTKTINLGYFNTELAAHKAVVKYRNENDTRYHRAKNSHK